jgi:hypothetical protein
MFYCEACAKSNNLFYEFWLPRSFGTCELCGRSAACVDGGVIIADNITKEILEKKYPDLSGKIQTPGEVNLIPKNIPPPKHKDRYELLKDYNPL